MTVPGRVMAVGTVPKADEDGSSFSANYAGETAFPKPGPVRL